MHSCLASCLDSTIQIQSALSFLKERKIILNKNVMENLSEKKEREGGFFF